ncbi:MAG: transglutaminase family protein [Erythrobacter sp.]|nr:transglutaminase family protein [Erythrobacter sp.]
MIYAVRHVSTVTYATPVKQAQFNLRLAPWAWPGQTLGRQVLHVSPHPDMRQTMPGPYCVNTTRLRFDNPLDRIEVTSEFTVEITPRPAPGEGPPAAQVQAEALAVRDLSVLAPAPYLFASRVAGVDPAIGDWASTHLLPQAGIVASVSALMAALHGEFTYSKGATTSTTPPEQAFAAREGVCQDFAHVMIMALRSHCIPAAYVSGYLRTLPPPGKPRLVGADAMHAWVNVWCGEEIGWLGFDPTNNCLSNGDHILIGMGRDYADVSPIDGTFIGNAPQKMTTAVDVVEAG